MYEIVNFISESKSQETIDQFIMLIENQLMEQMFGLQFTF